MNEIFRQKNNTYCINPLIWNLKLSKINLWRWVKIGMSLSGEEEMPGWREPAEVLEMLCVAMCNRYKLIKQSKFKVCVFYYIVVKDI